jgi:nucleoside 2-deoxyribosyltransferase
MRNVYIAHSVTNGCQNVRPIKALAAHLRKLGFRIVEPQRALFGEDVGKQATASIEKSDLIVADVSRYSHGVGFELGYSYAKGKAVILVCERGAWDNVSKVLVGLFPKIIIYDDANDLMEKLTSELAAT